MSIIASAQSRSDAFQGHLSFLHFHLPAHWPAQSDLLTWAQATGPGEAALFILIGVIYLLFGINLYKVLVMLNAALLGAFIGAVVGDKMGQAAAPGAIVGGFTAAAIAWPLMKYAVAIMGAGLGLLAGMSMWRALSLPPELHFAGGLIGAVSFGLLSFVLFKGCIMMYTSLQGATMAVFGIMSLMLKYPTLSPEIQHALLIKPFILPLAIFIPTLAGLIYQQSNPQGSAGAAKPPVKK